MKAKDFLCCCCERPFGPGSNKSTMSRCSGCWKHQSGKGCLPRVSDMPSHWDRPCTLPCFVVATSMPPSAPFPFRTLLPEDPPLTTKQDVQGQGFWEDVDARKRSAREATHQHHTMCCDKQMLLQECVHGAPLTMPRHSTSNMAEQMSGYLHNRADTPATLLA